MPPEKELKQYDIWNVPRPTHEAHGTDDDIRSNLTKGSPRNFRQQGNVLTFDTDFGEVSQTIPTSHILDGMDQRGLPKFRKIV